MLVNDSDWESKSSGANKTETGFLFFMIKTFSGNIDGGWVMLPHAVRELGLMDNMSIVCIWNLDEIVGKWMLRV